jgi:uncharacterized membrane protein YbhN (UPF0104 family)
VSKTWRIVGTVVLFAILAWRLDWAQFATAFVGMSPWPWLLACLVFVVAQLTSSLRWWYLATPVGFNVPLLRTVGIYWVGMFFNLVLPTSVGGDVIRAWFLTRQAPEYNSRWTEAFLCVFADRASGLAVLVLVACVAALFTPLPAWMAWICVALFAGLVLGVCCLPLLHLFTSLPLVGGVATKANELLSAYGREPGTQLLALLLSVVVQGAGVVQLWLIAQALGVDVPFAHCAVVVPLVSLFTLLPISVGGHGLREAAMVLLLVPVGIGEGQAITLSLLWLASCALVASSGGLIYLVGPFPSIQELRQEAEVRSQKSEVRKTAA